MFECEIVERRERSGLKDSGLMDTAAGISHVARRWKAACGRQHRAWVEARPLSAYTLIVTLQTTKKEADMRQEAMRHPADLLQ